MTTIPLAQNWTEMQVLVAGYLSLTQPPEDPSARDLRGKLETALSEAPVPIAYNRLAQAIYDAGDAADDDVKMIGVAILGGLSMMGTQNIGGIRNDIGAMRLVLMRELAIELPVGVAYPSPASDPARGGAGSSNMPATAD